MEEKHNEEKEIKELYDGLTEENKDVLNMVAKGMKIAQENSNHIPHID